MTGAEVYGLLLALHRIRSVTYDFQHTSKAAAKPGLEVQA